MSSRTTSTLCNYTIHHSVTQATLLNSRLHHVRNTFHTNPLRITQMNNTTHTSIVEWYFPPFLIPKTTRTTKFTNPIARRTWKFPLMARTCLNFKASTKTLKFLYLCAHSKNGMLQCFSSTTKRIKSYQTNDCSTKISTLPHHLKSRMNKIVGWPSLSPLVRIE